MEAWSLTRNPDSDIIVSLSIVVLQVYTVDARVRSLRSGNEELGVILALGDDFPSCSDDVILEPGYHWGRWSLLGWRREGLKSKNSFDRTYVENASPVAQRNIA